MNKVILKRYILLFVVVASVAAIAIIIFGSGYVKKFDRNQTAERIGISNTGAMLAPDTELEIVKLSDGKIYVTKTTTEKNKTKTKRKKSDSETFDNIIRIIEQNSLADYDNMPDTSNMVILDAGTAYFDADTKDSSFGFTLHESIPSDAKQAVYRINAILNDYFN